MTIRLQSTVKGNMKEVFDSFDESLFRYLLPPGAQLIRFDGSRPGNIVQLQFPLGIEWISEITSEEIQATHCYFIDIGVKLPTPLRDWKHTHHVVLESQDTSRIIDEMQFSSGYKLADLLLYPLLYLAFLPRVYQYKKYFSTLKSKPPSTH